MSTQRVARIGGRGRDVRRDQIGLEPFPLPRQPHRRETDADHYSRLQPTIRRLLSFNSNQSERFLQALEQWSPVTQHSHPPGRVLVH